MLFFSKHKTVLTWILGFLVIYLVTHLVGLTKMPVFADEAIYIRWAQLILDDAAQYFFFPLNDGKTPLFVWQLVPALLTFDDPLFAARLVSVLGGLLQLVAIVFLIKELKGKFTAQAAGVLLVIFLPFWFFHHRMALMDGWLTVWLTFAVLFLVRSIRLNNKWLAVGAGLCLGASLLTKLPAVLALPSLVLMSFVVTDARKKLKTIIIMSAITMGIGAVSFALLKVSPAFSQIFVRGSDFLFTANDVFNGIWFSTIHNTPSYSNYFWHYATPPVIVLCIMALFLKKNRKRTLLLILSFLAFCVPIALMGRVVFPRYLFPAMIFMTTLAALTVEDLWNYKQAVIKWSGVVLLTLAIIFSLHFVYFMSNDPDKTPFVSADRAQYLTEWSSGHGIREVYQLLGEEASTQKIAVATEGYFGTLPDGLLMYMHNDNVANISVEGVGQPIAELPSALIQKKDQYDRFWLLVNSHRKIIVLPENTLIASYCRPFQAPCLELWDVTEQVKTRE